MEIGAQLRNLRIQKNLTQEELGERTDLTKGYISQMEHNQSSPSMETFFAVLAVLGQSPEQFFKAAAQSQKVVYPTAEQTVFNDTEHGYQLRWLVPESNENEMEPVMINLEAAGSFKTFEPSPAETFIYVLKGKVCLQLGDQQYLATKGEAIYFHATQQHQIKNLATSRSQILLVATASYL